MHCDRGPGLGTGNGGFIGKAMGAALCARLRGEGKGSPGGVETGEGRVEAADRGLWETPEANASVRGSEASGL